MARDERIVARDVPGDAGHVVRDRFELRHARRVPWGCCARSDCRRAEQQARAKHGLNFVMDDYLPNKLREVAKFLP